MEDTKAKSRFKLLYLRRWEGIITTVLASAMMLEHLGCTEAAQTLDGAVQQLLSERRVLTRDLSGWSTTHEVFQKLSEKINTHLQENL